MGRVQADFYGVAEMRDEEVQHDPEKDQQSSDDTARNAEAFFWVVQVTKPKETGQNTGENVHCTDPKRHHHPAHQAGRLSVLKQERIETTFDDHDHKQNSEGLLDILFDVRGTFPDPVAVLLLEVLEFDDRRVVMISRCFRIINLIVAKLVLFRLDDFAQMFRMNICWRAILNEVANARGRAAHPRLQAAAHTACPLCNFLLALAPLILGHGVGRRNSICRILLSNLPRSPTAKPKIAFRKLSFQAMLAQRLF